MEDVRGRHAAHHAGRRRIRPPGNRQPAHDRLLRRTRQQQHQHPCAAGGSGQHHAGRVPPQRDRCEQPRRGENRGGLPSGPDRALAALAGHRWIALRRFPRRPAQQPHRRGFPQRGWPALAARRTGVQADRECLAVRQLQQGLPAACRRPAVLAERQQCRAGSGNLPQPRARREVGHPPGTAGQHLRVQARSRQRGGHRPGRCHPHDPGRRPDREGC